MHLEVSRIPFLGCITRSRCRMLVCFGHYIEWQQNEDGLNGALCCLGGQDYMYAADRHLAQFDMTYYMYLLVHFTTSNMTPIPNPFHKV